VSLRSASFEDLRAIGMSVTQANRVLRYRDDESLHGAPDLRRVPGFSKLFLAELQQRLRD